MTKKVTSRRILTAILVLVGLIAACGESCYQRGVTGKVVSIGERIKAGPNGGTEQKIALRLNPYSADSTVRGAAMGESGLDVECISTRCAALREGDCVSLVCLKDFRCNEPTVISCKMERTIRCEPPKEHGEPAGFNL